GVGAKAANEIAVDLEIVEGDVLQVVERAEAGAEIVQRKSAAATPQFRGELPRVVDVAHGGRFGQLEDQPPGVDTDPGQGPIDDMSWGSLMDFPETLTWSVTGCPALDCAAT